MELATADAVQPHPGEAAFILQLRPPASGRADALASELDRFTSLYLERAPGEQVRFTPLGALTWALCAPIDAVDAVDAACDSLAQTLFGDPASDYVHLARQPDHPRKEDYNIQDQALSDEEGEAVMQDLAEHEWDFASEDVGEQAVDSAEDVVDLDEPDEIAGPDADEAASALDDETVDLDAFEAPTVSDDADDWQFEDPLEGAANSEPESLAAGDIETVSDADADADIDLDADLDLDIEPHVDAEADTGDEALMASDDAMTVEPETDFDTGLAESEEDDLDFEIAQSPASDDASSPEMDVDLSEPEADDAVPASDPVMDTEAPDEPDDLAFEDASLAVDTEGASEDLAEDLALDDKDLASETDAEAAVTDPDEPALEGDLALDDFVLEDEDPRTPKTEIWDEDVDTVDIDDIAASALHETRLGSNLDIAAELNAFREEMRAIARSIPSGGLDATLSDFRAGLESLSGELGQRVDGAAQRIEAAVGQLDVERYDAASQRVESAAALMETSVHEALEALKRAGAAMSAPTASDMLAAQDRETL